MHICITRSPHDHNRPVRYKFTTLPLHHGPVSNTLSFHNKVRNHSKARLVCRPSPRDMVSCSTRTGQRTITTLTCPSTITTTSPSTSPSHTINLPLAPMPNLIDNHLHRLFHLYPHRQNIGNHNWIMLTPAEKLEHPMHGQEQLPQIHAVPPNPSSLSPIPIVSHPSPRLHLRPRRHPRL